MTKTLPALAVAAFALALSASPAGAAKKPKYYFSITTTETYITVADCKAIPSGRTKETTTTTRVITQTGHLGGGLKTEGWDQTDLKRESWDNEALPPVEVKGEKRFFGSKGRSTDELKVRGGRVTHREFGPDYEWHNIVLRLPARVNRETSKRGQYHVKRSFPPEPGDRCSYEYDNTHDVTVILQRIA